MNIEKSANQGPSFSPPLPDLLRGSTTSSATGTYLTGKYRSYRSATLELSRHSSFFLKSMYILAVLLYKSVVL